MTTDSSPATISAALVAASITPKSSPIAVAAKNGIALVVAGALKAARNSRNAGRASRYGGRSRPGRERYV
jgi:hypothetical protein